VAGLFACCSSSEVFELSWAEKRQLTKQTVQLASGRGAVLGSVMGDTAGRSLADAVREVGTWGVDAVVLNLAELAKPDESDAVLRQKLETLLDELNDCDVPLGLYECPTPYHRLAGLDLLRWAADSGRFVFFKDTCCDAVQLEQRLAAVANTSMMLFNAHTPLMTDTLRQGGAGFCGIGANFYPEMYNRLTAAISQSDDAAAGDIQQFLNRWDPVVHRAYPRSAKAYLALVGVPIGLTCRRPVAELTPDDQQTLRDLSEGVGLAVNTAEVGL
jgi:4-hydroxy-tetrahydrodipicolinate synthase